MVCTPQLFYTLFLQPKTLFAIDGFWVNIWTWLKYGLETNTYEFLKKYYMIDQKYKIKNIICDNQKNEEFLFSPPSLPILPFFLKMTVSNTYF